jgi:hypothetical protein
VWSWKWRKNSKGDKEYAVLKVDNNIIDVNVRIDVLDS